MVSMLEQETASDAAYAPKKDITRIGNSGPSTAQRAEVVAAIVKGLPSIEGWCTERKALWLAELIADNGCRTVLEVGIYGGKSLIPMAIAIKKYAPGGKVYGIEAWSNAVATQVSLHPQHDAWWANLDFKYIKTGFFRSVIANDVADVINVLDMSSDDAFKCLNAQRLTEFDLIHVDSSKSEGEELHDCKTWSGLLRPGGILVMDDIGWPSVQVAREYVKSNLSVIDEVFEAQGIAYGAYRRRP
jgi:predicted O-methyltransferase YrrM